MSRIRSLERNAISPDMQAAEKVGSITMCPVRILRGV